MLQLGQAPPRQPGTYLLWFDVPRPISLLERSLATATLEPGHYVYVGSALGPGGLHARVQRHLGHGSSETPPRLHWHVDRLASVYRPACVGFIVSPDRLECVWTHRLHAGGASWAIRGFGSSDCRQRCQSHLLRLPANWTIDTIKDLVA